MCSRYGYIGKGEIIQTSAIYFSFEAELLHLISACAYILKIIKLRRFSVYFIHSGIFYGFNVIFLVAVANYVNVRKSY